MLNGLVNMEILVPAPTFDFPGLKECSRNTRRRAEKKGSIRSATASSPFGYAAGQVLAQAVEATKSLDQEKIADYIRSHTVQDRRRQDQVRQGRRMGQVAPVFTQFQNIKPNDLEQFRAGTKQPILWPPEYKTGNMIYPYANARKK